MSTQILPSVDPEGVSFVPQSVEKLPDAPIEASSEPPVSNEAESRGRLGLRAIAKAASSAASIWRLDDPMPSVAEFFLVLQRSWRHR